jgi:ribA/ribD-fused uncharacterized protein
VVHRGRTFRSSEEAYQFQKPKDPLVAEWLIKAPSQSILAVTAHSLLPFHVKTDWNEVKVGIMKDVVTAKFLQHCELMEKLLGTDDRPLIEASKTDGFWGEGRDGKGKNMLGQILMEVRKTGYSIVNSRLEEEKPS